MLLFEQDHYAFNLLLMALVLFSACGGHSEPPPQESAPEIALTEDDPIDIATRRLYEVKHWLRRAELSGDSINYECQNDPTGGRITFYRKNGELVMLQHDFYQGDHFGATERFYLIDDQPVFIHLEEERWNFAGPESDDSSIPHTRDDISEFRFYLDEQQRPKNCLRKDYVLRSWIELPTNPDEVPNKPTQCGEKVRKSLDDFGLLVNGLVPFVGC